MVAHAECEIAESQASGTDGQLEHHPKPAHRFGKVDLEASRETGSIFTRVFAGSQSRGRHAVLLVVAPRRDGDVGRRPTRALYVVAERALIEDDRSPARRPNSRQVLPLAVGWQKRPVLLLERGELLGGGRACVVAGEDRVS